MLTNAKDFCERAGELVSGDRQNTHGDKRRNFDNIAQLWNGYLKIRRDPQAPLDARNVGQMFVLVKIARGELGAYNEDDALDQVGYSLCVAEITALNLRTD